MKAIDRILVFAYLFLLSIFLLTIIVDTVGIIIDPSAHITSYVFIESRESWFERSIFNYIVGNALYFTVAGSLFFIGVKKLTNRNDRKLWNNLFYLCFVGLIISLAYGYYHCTSR